jgi:DNA-binding NtrC family response regulator
MCVGCNKPTSLLERREPMVNSRKLIGMIAENGMTRHSVAEMLGITENTLRRKLNSGKFNSDEMYNLVKLLNITDPIAIFFADEIA